MMVKKKTTGHFGNEIERLSFVDILTRLGIVITLH